MCYHVKLTSDYILHCSFHQGSKELPAKQLTQHTVPQPSHIVSQPSHAVLQPPQSVPQPSHAVLQPPQTVTQPSHAVPQSLYTVPQHPHTVPQPLHAVHLLPNVVPQPPQTVPQAPNVDPQPTQTALPHLHPGSIEGASLPTFVHFAMPPNFFSSPAVNSTLQAPLQHGVPSSLTAPHSSTLSLLSALQDDKLGLILPVLVRMEHKIDQIMTMIGAKPFTGMSNGAQIGNQLNTTVVGNQSNATGLGNQSNATAVGSQSNATTVGSQSNATAASYHLNSNTGNQLPTTETQRIVTETTVEEASTSQSNVNMTGTPSNTTAIARQSGPATMASQSSGQSSTSLTEPRSNDSTMGSQGVVAFGRGCKLNTLSPLSSFNSSTPLPGMSPRQRIRLEMAKITEKTLPDDLNLPISRDEIISLHARSNSTMNFAVRLLRELFTRDELLGRNLSGARGKDRVDPARVAIIKQIVFKIYQTSPSDKELLWRYCHKAMDSYLRKMQRPIVVQEQV